jgi:hypothetical protein
MRTGLRLTVWPVQVCSRILIELIRGPPPRDLRAGADAAAVQSAAVYVSLPRYSSSISSSPKRALQPASCPRSWALSGSSGASAEGVVFAGILGIKVDAVDLGLFRVVVAQRRVGGEVERSAQPALKPPVQPLVKSSYIPRCWFSQSRWRHSMVRVISSSAAASLPPVGSWSVTFAAGQIVGGVEDRGVVDVVAGASVGDYKILRFQLRGGLRSVLTGHGPSRWRWHRWRRCLHRYSSRIHWLRRR